MNDDLEKMHRMYSLRVAIGCVLGALPAETQARVRAALGQHILALEEATLVPGAAALAEFMAEEFECLTRAAAVMPTFVKPPVTPPVAKPKEGRTRRKSQ